MQIFKKLCQNNDDSGSKELKAKKQKRSIRCLQNSNLNIVENGSYSNTSHRYF